MKKAIHLIVGIVCGLAFQADVFSLFLLVTTRLDGGIVGNSFYYSLIGSLCVGFILLVFIEIANHAYDHEAKNFQKRKPLSRWGMNTIFAGVVFLFMLSNIYYNVNHGEIDTRAVVAFVMVTFAILVYFKNYQRFRPRLERVDELITRNCINGKRRYHFLVEDVKENGQIQGFLHGTMKTGDIVHLINAGENPNPVKITSIVRNGRKEKLAKNGEIEITVSSKKSPNIGKYSVISNIRKGYSKQGEISAENPRVLAMINGYFRHPEDNEYIGLLVYDACHANYIVPAKLVEEEMSGDIMDGFSDSKNVVFLSVSTNEHASEPIFPIFTDWEALSRYQHVMEEENMVSVILTFPQCISMARQNYEGIVINPFGPTPYMFSNEYVNHITSLPGYKEDFIYPKQDEE